MAALPDLLAGAQIWQVTHFLFLLVKSALALNQPDETIPERW